jgi:2-polyprenyl-3-methyl-5-hydroxy-6-metoxy-1,4-benzoquinol methylase
MDNRTTLETWDKVAGVYQDKFMDFNLYNESYKFFCSTLNKDKSKILDIGCGPGNITRFLTSKRSDFDIYGIDFSSNMIELAKKNNPLARFSVMDCRNISNFKTTYDGIICGFCIPYLSSKECTSFITDCYNLLNNEGLLYISFVEGDPKKSGYQVGSTGDKVFFHYHRLEDLKNQLMINNFQEIDLFKYDYKKSEFVSELHIVIIAKKSIRFLT